MDKYTTEDDQAKAREQAKDQRYRNHEIPEEQLDLLRAGWRIGVPDCTQEALQAAARRLRAANPLLERQELGFPTLAAEVQRHNVEMHNNRREATATQSLRRFLKYADDVAVAKNVEWAQGGHLTPWADVKGYIEDEIRIDGRHEDKTVVVRSARKAGKTTAARKANGRIQRARVLAGNTALLGVPKTPLGYAPTMPKSNHDKEVDEIIEVAKSMGIALDDWQKSFVSNILQLSRTRAPRKHGKVRP